MGARGWPLLLTALLWGATQAQTLPRWEAGVGIAALGLPDYRGSATTRGYLIPFPYFIYRGERVRFDEQGLRGDLLRSHRTRLELSLAAGLPVPAEQDDARAGMEPLKPTVEIGPSLNLDLWHSADHRHDLRLILPLRAVFAVDLPNLPHEGWTFSPALQLNLRHLHHGHWRASMTVGPIWASGDYHAYFYDVKATEATATRPAYEASGGYGGARFTLLFKRAWDDKRLALFARADTLAGSAFVDSPLVEREHYYMVGASLIWVFTKSSQSGTLP